MIEFARQTLKKKFFLIIILRKYLNWNTILFGSLIAFNVQPSDQLTFIFV